MTRTLVFAKRNFKELIRDPLALVFNVAMPLIMLICFSMFDAIAPETDQFSIAVLAPGIVMFAYSFLTLFCGLNVAMDRTSSFLTRLFSSPMTGFDFIMGYCISCMPIALGESVLFFLVALILDFSVLGIGMLWAILILIPLSWFYLGAGLLFGTICSDKSVGGISSVIISAASILSGMWFPSQVFEISKTFDVITRALPFRNAVDIVKIFFANDFANVDFANDVLIPLIIVMAYTVVVFVLAILLFNKKMKSDKQ